MIDIIIESDNCTPGRVIGRVSTTHFPQMMFHALLYSFCGYSWILTWLQLCPAACSYSL